MNPSAVITIREIKTMDAMYPLVEKIWLKAFPKIERRDTNEQQEKIDHEELMHCLVAELHGKVIGLFTYWDFGAFGYGEHFATDAALRGKGYGAQIIRHVLRILNKPFVLEVELPEDEMSKRRIAFYERNGLELRQEIHYIQPSYRIDTNEELPMALMTTPDFVRLVDIQEAIHTIHRMVYGCKE